METKDTNSSNLLQELGSEVNEESAPLLEFITKHGGKIAAGVLAFFLVAAASGIWQWYTGKNSEDYLTELARFSQMQDKKAALSACINLAATCPSSLISVTYLTIGDLAIQNQDLDQAGQAYAKAAQADADGTTGFMAEIAYINTLVRNNKASEALGRIEDLEARLATKNLGLTQLKAIAAIKNGDHKLAAQILETMSKEMPGDEADFYRYQAKELAKQGAKQ